MTSTQAAPLLLRRGGAVALFFLSLWLWTWPGPSDLIYLIVNWKPVLLNRYSQGHFGALLVLTPILWVVAAALWSRRPLRGALGNAAISIGSTLVAILVVTYVAHFFRSGPRYVEGAVDVVDQGGETAPVGTVRHRPPNERYDFTWVDQPERPRSYPAAPAGYGAVPIVLTSDAQGFRNPRPSPAYELVAVGDSFVAGSHVSDDHGWTELLQDALALPIYNLGVSGAGPRTYLNNFAAYGVPLAPRAALFMIYEGNDFKEDVATQPGPAVAPTLAERLEVHVETAFKSSPVTAGLRRLSDEVLQRAGAGSPVPGYAEQVGLMPLAVQAPDGVDHYAFPPKRLIYLNVGRDAFAASASWQSIAGVLEEIRALCARHRITPLLVYAPSAPHVVLPLAAERIPAEQLRNFLGHGSSRYQRRDPVELKAEVLGNLDNQERVFSDYCDNFGVACLTLTAALQEATARGIQTYYTYDQHWTPEGNRVVATELAAWLRQLGVTGR